ncbi:hypothetical protein AMK68_01200 [candidate division KD3-62 bacterium DG_56]|uniref:Uncharacterized protein n=1 Tax=candidate division KD3-62 bacterium DG_56 TaxID=1704032 RepID=A0A0S7XQA5_9BACT|nr:MAG: hypothetical protein AMK68_01200 [candidate division KD3-62 bacterium DG_56]
MKRSVIAILGSAVAVVAVAGICRSALAAGGELRDLERIAYQWSQIGVREIRVMHANGAQAVDVPALPGGARDKITPALSPDGTTVVFAAPTEGHFKIWAWQLGPDNKPIGQPRQVTFGDTDDEQPAFSPDGTKIAYLARKDGERTIEVKPFEGNQAPTRAAVISGGFHAATPSWSPDGEEIVYAQDDGLWRVSLDGDQQRLYDRGNYPAWSPDGKRVAFMVRNDPQTSSLWSLDINTLTPTRVLDKLSGAGAAAWSPDGQRIAFKATEVGNRAGRHWTVKVDGTGLTPLPTQNEPSAYLAWAPVNIAVAALPEEPGVIPEPAVIPEPSPGPVKIVNPRDGQTVRGDVRIKAELPDPEGYVMVRIANATGGDLLVGLNLDQGFRLAVARPWEYLWDTRADGDGEKIISLDGYDQTPQYLGTATIRVKVENEIRDTRIAQDGVLLKVEFKRGGQKVTREIKASADATDQYDFDRSQQLSALAAEVDATLVKTVERIDRFTDVTLLRNRLRGRDSTITAGGVAYPLFESAVYARTELRPSGFIEPLRRTGGDRLALAEMSLELPSRPVRIGETWRSPMKVVTELVSRQGATVQGTHLLERLEWEGDYRCAKIKSTYDLATVRIPLTIKTGLEEETAPGAWAPGAGLPPPVAGWRPIGEAEAATTVTMKGVRATRYTWVAYEARQVIRIEDVLVGSLDVPTQWLSGIAPTGTTGTGGTSYTPSTGYRPYTGSETAYTPVNYRITLSNRLTALTQ